eukprot:scpid88593/ scgid5455/ 
MYRAFDLSTSSQVQTQGSFCSSVAGAIHYAVKLNSPEVVTFVSKIDIFYRDVAHADRHRRTDLLKMVKRSKVDTINLAWTSLLETLSKLPSHEKMDVLDLETTSAVFSSLICGTVVARKPSIMPGAPQPTAIVNCTAETPKRYHGGWCVVAVRRELEASRKPELTSLKPVLATFGHEILANMSPNLPNFEKIIESETHEHPPCVCSCVCMCVCSLDSYSEEGNCFLHDHTLLPVGVAWKSERALRRVIWGDVPPCNSVGWLYHSNVDQVIGWRMPCVQCNTDCGSLSPSLS